jgi:biotin carboxyl carrier protein
MKLTVDDVQHDIVLEGECISVDGREFTVTVAGEGRVRTVRVDDRPYRVELPETLAPPLTVTVEGEEHRVVAEDLQRLAPRPPQPPPRPAVAAAPGAVIARMAGRILRVDVTPGQEVQAGALLVILEAMKMENEITAPTAGTVKAVPAVAGQRVTEGDTLVVIE